MPQVYNLLVPALIETVDKLDLSTEPEIKDEGDQVDEETEMDTLSETQVKVSHLVPSRLWYTHLILGDSISESKLCRDHPKSVGSETEGLQGEGSHCDGQPGHLGLPCSPSCPHLPSWLGTYPLAITWCLGLLTPSSVCLVQDGQDTCERGHSLGQEHQFSGCVLPVGGI